MDEANQMFDDQEADPGVLEVRHLEVPEQQLRQVNLPFSLLLQQLSVFSAEFFLEDR